MLYFSVSFVCHYIHRLHLYSARQIWFFLFDHLFDDCSFQLLYRLHSAPELYCTFLHTFISSAIRLKNPDTVSKSQKNAEYQSEIHSMYIHVHICIILLLVFKCLFPEKYSLIVKCIQYQRLLLLSVGLWVIFTLHFSSMPVQQLIVQLLEPKLLPQNLHPVGLRELEILGLQIQFCLQRKRSHNITYITQRWIKLKCSNIKLYGKIDHKTGCSFCHPTIPVLFYDVHSSGAKKFRFLSQVKHTRCPGYQ